MGNTTRPSRIAPSCKQTSASHSFHPSVSVFFTALETADGMREQRGSAWKAKTTPQGQTALSVGQAAIHPGISSTLGYGSRCGRRCKNSSPANGLATIPPKPIDFFPNFPQKTAIIGVLDARSVLCDELSVFLREANIFDGCGQKDGK